MAVARTISQSWDQTNNLSGLGCTGTGVYGMRQTVHDIRPGECLPSVVNSALFCSAPGIWEQPTALASSADFHRGDAKLRALESSPPLVATFDFNNPYYSLDHT